MGFLRYIGNSIIIIIIILPSSFNWIRITDVSLSVFGREMVHIFLFRWFFEIILSRWSIGICVIPMQDCNMLSGRVCVYLISIFLCFFFYFFSLTHAPRVFLAKFPISFLRHMHAPFTTIRRVCYMSNMKHIHRVCECMVYMLTYRTVNI